MYTEEKENTYILQYQPQWLLLRLLTLACNVGTIILTNSQCERYDFYNSLTHCTQLVAICFPRDI